jgi:outer membrane lipoprotein-sorting protein
MKKSLLRLKLNPMIALSVLMLLMLVSLPVFAAVAGFSADFSMTDAKGKVATGKIFVQGLKIRQETNAKGQNAITILRMDKKITWTLMPDSKQYMEIAIPFDPNHPVENNKDFEYEKTVLGNETVNGYDCQVEQYTYKNKKYGIMTQWVANQLGYAVKYQNKNSNGKVTTTMDYTNIKTGKQDDSLFEVPAGYEKFALPFKLPN